MRRYLWAIGRDATLFLLGLLVWGIVSQCHLDDSFAVLALLWVLGCFAWTWEADSIR